MAGSGINESSQTTFSEIGVAGSALGSPLISMLMADAIVPGSSPSYELCKTIYLYHPLGQKLAESPISMSQSQARLISVQGAPEEVVKEFEKVWQELGCDSLIKNTKALSRVYGIAALVMGVKGKSTETPLALEDIWDQPIYFNVLDPLNTAGSLVLSQIPTAPEFNKPVQVVTNGEAFHKSRFRVVMNEQPVYLAYTSSAFGFVGRSVYQRALYPLKSFLRTMVADDMIATKLGLLVAKMKSPGSVTDRVMHKLQALKRALLKDAQTNNVISIGLDEEVETVDMTNVDGAGVYSRGNILKNIATAANMPAQLVENETMVAGFGEGTEDAKNIAGYVEQFRMELQELYTWLNAIVMYKAWSPTFFEKLQQLKPDVYDGRSFEDVSSEWRDKFSAIWPSLLRESESEQVKVDDVRFQAAIALFQTLAAELDPLNKAMLIEWLCSMTGTSKRLFQDLLELDLEELKAFQETKQEQSDAQTEADTEATTADATAPMAKKFGKM